MRADLKKENSIPDEDRRRCSRPRLTPQTTGHPRNHHQTINCAPGSPHKFQRDWKRGRLLDNPRVLVAVSFIRPGRTSHCSNNNKLSDIHSEVSANTGSCLPFNHGWNNLFQPLPSEFLRQNIKQAYQSGFEWGRGELTIASLKTPTCK